MTSPLFIGFDIETRPLPELVTKFAQPYPDFDEAAVKYGNTRDPAKRAALLAEKRQEHENGRAPYWANLIERAALDPFTGALVCIGVITDNGTPEIISETTEAGTLRKFWALYAAAENATTKFVFWSGRGDAAKKFDPDFIVTRSRIVGVKLPLRVRQGRYYDPRLVDLAGEFLLHQRDRYLSLTKAAEMLRLYEQHPDIIPKRDDDLVQGKDFWRWWQGTACPEAIPENRLIAAQQRIYAEVYLCNDLLHLKYIAPRILP